MTAPSASSRRNGTDEGSVDATVGGPLDAAAAQGISALTPPILPEGQEGAAVPPPVPDALSMSEAVDAAVIGDVFADSPEATPQRELTSVADYVSVYVRYRGALEAHARRFLRDPHDVEDVVQETFLKLFLAMEEVTTESHAVAFSRRVITNLCIDRYRAAKRRPNLVTFVPDSDADLADDGADLDPVVQAEDAAIVRQALAALSPLHRAALVKREIEEKPLPQIAAELGIPEDKVKHLLHRARRALRRLLAGTQVDPASTLGEDLAAARQRAGNGMVDAGAYLVILVLMVVGAIGLHPWSPSTHDVSSGYDDGGSTVPAQPTHHAGAGTPSAGVPGAGGTLPAPHHSPSRHRPAGGSSGGAPATGTVPTTAPTAPVREPSTAPPVSAPSSPVGTPQPVTSAPSLPNAGQYTLEGAYEATGKAAIKGEHVLATKQPGVTALKSTFSVPTTQGTFALEQTVTTATTEIAPTLSIEAQLPLQGEAVGTVQLGNSTQSEALSQGAQALRGWVSVTPVGTMTSQPFQIYVALVVSPQADQVLSESVSVDAPAPAIPTPSPNVSVPDGGVTLSTAPTPSSSPTQTAGTGRPTKSTPKATSGL